MTNWSTVVEALRRNQPTLYDSAIRYFCAGCWRETWYSAATGREVLESMELMNRWHKECAT